MFYFCYCLVCLLCWKCWCFFSIRSWMFTTFPSQTFILILCQTCQRQLRLAGKDTFQVWRQFEILWSLIQVLMTPVVQRYQARLGHGTKHESKNCQTGPANHSSLDFNSTICRWLWRDISFPYMWAPMLIWNMWTNIFLLVLASGHWTRSQRFIVCFFV